METLTITKQRITNPEFDGVDIKDYPRFTDAFMTSCKIDGVDATDEELDLINEGLVHEFYEEIYQTLIR